jgi:hypothetical protein
MSTAIKEKMKRTEWLYKSNNQALENTNLNDNKTLLT